MRGLHHPSDVTHCVCTRCEVVSVFISMRCEALQDVTSLMPRDIPLAPFQWNLFPGFFKTFIVHTHAHIYIIYKYCMSAITKCQTSCLCISPTQSLVNTLSINTSIHIMSKEMSFMRPHNLLPLLSGPILLFQNPLVAPFEVDKSSHVVVVSV